MKTLKDFKYFLNILNIFIFHFFKNGFLKNFWENFKDLSKIINNFIEKENSLKNLKDFKYFLNILNIFIFHFFKDGFLKNFWENLKDPSFKTIIIKKKKIEKLETFQMDFKYFLNIRLSFLRGWIFEKLLRKF